MNLFAFVSPDQMGGKMDYAHHVTDGLALFAEAWGGATRDPLRGDWAADYGAQVGGRLTF